MRAAGRGAMGVLGLNSLGFSWRQGSAAGPCLWGLTLRYLPIARNIHWDPHTPPIMPNDAWLFKKVI